MYSFIDNILSPPPPTTITPGPYGFQEKPLYRYGAGAAD